MNLVTGGTGLVGSHLLLSLVRSDKKVRATYRSESSLQKTRNVFQKFDSLSNFDKIEWVKADITDYFSLQDVFVGVTNVFHSAAMVSFHKKDEKKLMKVNVEGTRNIVNLSLENKVAKFCFVSSVSALGEYDNNKCVDEGALWQYTADSSSYSISKYYSENEVWRGSEEGLDVIIVNPSTIIGYGAIDESSSTIIKKVRDGLSYYTPGANGFVGVDDVVKAMIQLMDSDLVNERYILNSANWSFKQLLSEIALGLGLNPPYKLASRRMGIAILYLDQMKSIVLNSGRILSKTGINTAYNTKCYSSLKIENEIGFRFENLSKVIKETTLLYNK